MSSVIIDHSRVNFVTWTVRICSKPFELVRTNHFRPKLKRQQGNCEQHRFRTTTTSRRTIDAKRLLSSKDRRLYSSDPQSRQHKRVNSHARAVILCSVN